MSLSRVVLLLAVAASVVACQSAPVTGRKQLILVSESQAIDASKEAYAQTLAPLQKQGKVNDDAALKARVDRITARLVAQAINYRPETEAWDWQVAVIDDPKTLNAWCMAGGRMAIYTGLIQQLHLTDDEIAQVMGHEIAHALAKHTAERMSSALAQQAGLSIAGSTPGRWGHGSDGTAGRRLGNHGRTAATKQPYPGSRGRSHRHRAGRKGWVRSACRTNALAEDDRSDGLERQVRLAQHTSGGRKTTAIARGADPGDDAVLRGQVATPGVQIQDGRCARIPRWPRGADTL